MDKVHTEEKYIVKLKRNIKRIEEQVELDKTIEKVINISIDYLMEMFGSNENVKSDFFAKYFEL